MQNMELKIKYLNSLNFRDKIYFCYCNKDDLNNILGFEELIEINNSNEEIYLNDYFYLSLIIMHNSEIITFSFDLNFIERINEYKKKLNEPLKKILFSKIILILLDNFRELVDEDDKDIINQIDNIEKENEDFIKKNINIFEQFGLNYDLNDIKMKNIDEIYIEIIYGLIQKNKFDDYEYTKDVLINQLEIQSITITKKMIAQLPRVLNYDDNCVKRYIISKESDLFIKNKINFNYLWIKYILKDIVYIDEIPLFLNNWKYIQKILVNYFIKNNFVNCKFLDMKIKKRMEYLLNIITNYEYFDYLILDKLKLILKYLEFNNTNNLYNDKINKIKKITENKKGYYEEFLEYYDAALILNNKLTKIEEILKENNIEIDNNIILYAINNYETFIKDFYICYYSYLLYNIFENSSFELILENNSIRYKISNINNIYFNKKEINYKKLCEIKENKKSKKDSLLINNFEKLLAFLNEIGNELRKSFGVLNLQLTLKFQKAFQNKNNYIFNISCFYSLSDAPYLSYKDENILIRKNNREGFRLLIRRIENKYKNLKYIFNSIESINHQRNKKIIEKMEMPENYDEKELVKIQSEKGFIKTKKNILLNERNINPKRIVFQEKPFSYINNNILFTYYNIEKAFLLLIQLINDISALCKRKEEIENNKGILLNDNYKKIRNKKTKTNISNLCKNSIFMNENEIIVNRYLKEYKKEDIILIYDIKLKNGIRS